jgi:tRNA(Ile)-lysidine synthase
MLKTKDIDLLKKSKNLLAFSAGADSTALFFLLLEENISFDIAIVDYGIREQSKEEVAYARQLAQSYQKYCFVFQAQTIQSNFEANARKIRYDFFEEKILLGNYTTLLTAHHLGDRLEWFMMQLCKGAGYAQLNSLQPLTQKENYTLIRPLLHLSKSDLISYLLQKGEKWFEDESNTDITIKRNEFRHLITNPLLEKYQAGITKSFEYMDEDFHQLIPPIELKHIKELYHFKKTPNIKTDIYHIDKILKSLGIMISKSVRDQLQTQKQTVIARSFVVCMTESNIYVAPFLHTSMQKKFKERCRVLGIPSKLRPYLFMNQEILEYLFH